MNRATLIRESLARSRRSGLQFDEAWKSALALPLPAEEDVAYWTPAVEKFARKAFLEGYYRRNVIGTASILGEDYDDDTVVPGGTILGHGTVIA